MKNKTESLFDNYADNYYQVLNKTLSITGENTTFFAKERIKLTDMKIKRFLPAFKAESVLDYGCGTGDTIPIIDEVLHPSKITGIDLSVKNIEHAKSKYYSPGISFFTPGEFSSDSKVQLTYCNGVFHHISSMNERRDVVKFICKSLSDNGLFAFWENNPINPATRYIMSICPFDKDAIPLSAGESKKLLENNGFRIIDISFFFIFPGALSFLRFSESFFSGIPIGAQYLILAQKI
jgi:predicted TPR repeat methyltransferase